MSIKEHYDLYTNDNKLDNLDEMEKFLERQKLPKWFKKKYTIWRNL